MIATINQAYKAIIEQQDDHVSVEVWRQNATTGNWSAPMYYTKAQGLHRAQEVAEMYRLQLADMYGDEWTDDRFSVVIDTRSPSLRNQ